MHQQRWIPSRHSLKQPLHRWKCPAMWRGPVPIQVGQLLGVVLLQKGKFRWSKGSWGSRGWVLASEGEMSCMRRARLQSGPNCKSKPKRGQQEHQSHHLSMCQQRRWWARPCLCLHLLKYLAQWQGQRLHLLPKPCLLCQPRQRRVQLASLLLLTNLSLLALCLPLPVPAAKALDPEPSDWPGSSRDGEGKKIQCTSKWQNSLKPICLIALNNFGGIFFGGYNDSCWCAIRDVGHWSHWNWFFLLYILDIHT